MKSILANCQVILADNLQLKACTYNRGRYLKDTQPNYTLVAGTVGTLAEGLLGTRVSARRPGRIPKGGTT
jgi:hypothetical protein